VAVLRLIDFDVGMATRSDVERVVAKINGNKRWREQTKYHKRVVLRRLIQYAKCGTCERGAPVPPEVSWIKLSKSSRDSRVTPENLLTPEEFEAIVRSTENARDKAMLYVLFEGALRPGELLSMSVGSVEFKDIHCLITVNGKTGLKRVPLVVSYRPPLELLEQHWRRTIGAKG
jgi:integrase